MATILTSLSTPARTSVNPLAGDLIARLTYEYTAAKIALCGNGF